MNTRFCHCRQLVLAILTLAVLPTVASAGGWSSGPQPLITGPAGTQRGVAKADAGSSLVMDSGWRCLYSVLWDELMLNYWTGSYFSQVSLRSKLRDKNGAIADQASADRCAVKPGSALGVDQLWHMLFYVSEDKGLVSAFRSGTQWKTASVEPSASQLLGVDSTWHIVYGYDQTRRSVLAIHWDGIAKIWKSEVVLSNVGAPGGEGAIDTGWHVLYTSHEDAPGLADTGLADQPDAYGLFKQWPLVATWWDGAQWRSQMIDKTAIPQRPAVRMKDHRVFYGRRDEVSRTRWFQPTTNPFTTTKNSLGKTIKLLTNLVPSAPSVPLGFEDLWLGQDSYLDDQNWVIDWNPAYSKGWLTTNSSSGSWNSSVTTGTGNWNWRFTNYSKTDLKEVDCYIPAWASVELPARIKRLQLTVDDRRGELVQQRDAADAGAVYVAGDWTRVPNVFQRADGRFIRLDSPVPDTGIHLADSRFGSLEGTVGNRFVTLDPSAPAPGPYLAPSSSRVKSFGHLMSSKAAGPALGGRYQNYTDTQEVQSDVGGIATDWLSTFVFYTQPPDPALNTYVPALNQPFAEPRAAVAPNVDGTVWIVVIF